MSAPTEMMSTPVAAISGMWPRCDAAAGFDQRTAGNLGNSRVKLSSGEVVEQDRFRPSSENCFDLVRVIDFYFYMRGMRKVSTHRLQSFS